MNELIKVNYNSDRQTTSARTLWEFLGKPWGQFSKWFEQFKGYGFIENVDYRLVSTKILTNNPKNPEYETTDYEITIEMAKELCMLQKTEKGKQARQYFIDLEKQWNSPEAIMARALKMADAKLLVLQSQIVEMKPKAESFDSLMNSDGLFCMSNVAKILNYEGIGPKNIFKVLVTEEVFFKKYHYYSVYQKYLDSGYFKEKVTTYQKGQENEREPYSMIFVTPKGLDWLDKFLKDKGYQKSRLKAV